MLKIITRPLFLHLSYTNLRFVFSFCTVPNQTPEKKQVPSALGDSPGDSAVESISGPSSDEMTPPKNKVH